MKKAKLDILKKMYEQGMLSPDAGSLKIPKLSVQMDQASLGIPQPSSNPLKQKKSAFSKLRFK